MKRCFLQCLAAVLSVVALCNAFAQPARPPIELPGQRPDGSVLLPNQWSLRPVGRQIPVGDFPINIAVHPSSRFAAVLHSGYGKHEIVVVDLSSSAIVARRGIEESFYGLEFSRDGTQLFCSGAGDEVIHRFTFQSGALSNHRKIQVRNAKERGVPAGLAISRDARTLYLANVWGAGVTILDLIKGKSAGDISVRLAPAISGAAPVIPPADPDLAAATKRDEAALDPADPNAPFPYACAVDERRGILYVSLWAQAAVCVIDLKTRKVVARWATEEHPNEMLLTKSGRILYVANANRNTVTALDTTTGRPLETLVASLYASPLPGTTPNSLAVSPNEKMLFVANACNNNVAVFDVTTPGKSRSMGFIPVGWYPTSVRVTPDGTRLLVANGKGLISKANPGGPQPVKKPAGTIVEYIGGLFQGTLSIIDLPVRKQFEQQLPVYTAQAYRCSPLNADGGVTVQRPAGNPIPLKPGDASPIKYCIYIIKENRTYDQVLGDMPQGNGDPSLCLFPEKVTPNHHALAREFVLLDNFYVESEVSADGHEWTVGAYATDFVEKSWPLSYGHKKSGKFPYPSEGRFAIAEPAGGYLWDRAREAKVSYRSYGEFVNLGKTAKDPAFARVAGLRGHIDEWFHPWDMDYPDVKRTERFLQEIKRFEKEGDMPRLQIVRLPNDHTFGTTAGKPTPTAMVAENDLALGMLIEGVSKSRFWPQTAIFVVEDDAQNGPDHVDAHRTIAYAISPYIKRGYVDSTMYSTSSMLRTMELILGLKPMSQFDAAATPMYYSFQEKPDLTYFKARPANVNLNEKNLKTAWGSEQSKKMDFTKEDAADDLLLNEVIWRSVRGADHPMPPPTRAAFVFAHPNDGDDD
jgi:hypothetical protein